MIGRRIVALQMWLLIIGLATSRGLMPFLRSNTSQADSPSCIPQRFVGLTKPGEGPVHLTNHRTLTNGPWS